MTEGAPHVRASIIAITDEEQSYAYPHDVIFEIRESEPEDYVTAARILNEGRFDVVSLQHEFGIFGGPDGEFILTLLSHLRVPVVTTCHTILADPTPSQHHVLKKSPRTPIVLSLWRSADVCCSRRFMELRLRR